MKAIFRPATVADHERIAAFLDRVFDSPRGDTLTLPAHTQWKYWAERPDWKGSRSYVLEQDGAIVAHGCGWPLQIMAEDRILSGLHLIDWAADPKVSGAGILLLRHMSRLAELTCSVGGSEVTRSILPALGFRPLYHLSYFARPLRPVRQILTHQYRNWKSPLRVARNCVWRWFPPIGSPDRWEATRVAPSEIPVALWPRPSKELIVCRRSAETYEYLLRCTVARWELWLIMHQGRARGYFVLTHVGQQARIVDLWVASPEQEDWEAAYRLAAFQALRRAGAYEVTAAASLEIAVRALLRSGFRSFGKWPVHFYEDRQTLFGENELFFQMVDGDAAFVNSGRPNYVT